MMTESGCCLERVMNKKMRHGNVLKVFVLQPSFNLGKWRCGSIVVKFEVMNKRKWVKGITNVFGTMILPLQDYV